MDSERSSHRHIVFILCSRHRLVGLQQRQRRRFEYAGKLPFSEDDAPTSKETSKSDFTHGFWPNYISVITV